MRTDTNPVDLTGDSVTESLRSDAADPNDSVKPPCPNCSHAIFSPETAVPVRVPIVGPLVDENTHDYISREEKRRKKEDSEGGGQRIFFLGS